MLIVKLGRFFWLDILRRHDRMHMDLNLHGIFISVLLMYWVAGIIIIFVTVELK